MEILALLVIESLMGAVYLPQPDAGRLFPDGGFPVSMVQFIQAFVTNGKENLQFALKVKIEGPR